MTSPVPSDPGQVSLPKEKPRLHRQCGFTAKGDEACKDARGATLFRLVHDGQQKIPRMKRKGCLHQSHSSRPVGLARKRTCLSRSALVTVASPGPASGGALCPSGKPVGPQINLYPLFAVRLPGPFTLCVAIPFSPVRDSLEPALSATIPVHSLFSSVVMIDYTPTDSSCQFPLRAVVSQSSMGQASAQGRLPPPEESCDYSRLGTCRRIQPFLSRH